MPSEQDEHRLVGSRLREAREVLNLTQSEVATALELSRTSVLSIEAGNRKVSGLELRRFARLYRRSVGWLLGEDEASDDVIDSALYRAAADLTENDKQQVLRFAQFLAAGGSGIRPGTANDSKAEPPPVAEPPLRRRRRQRQRSQ